MKKSLTLLLLVILSSLSFAQDIIITKDKERIQAKILEVSQDEIKYKKFTYQDGPIFSIDIDEVVTVAYENGEVEVYDEETIEEKNEIIQAKAEALRKQEAMFGTFSKEDDFYYLYDRDKTTKMDQKAYLQFIQDNCPEAYRSYQKGNTLVCKKENMPFKQAKISGKISRLKYLFRKYWLFFVSNAFVDGKLFDLNAIRMELKKSLQRSRTSALYPSLSEVFFPTTTSLYASITVTGITVPSSFRS